MFREFIARHRSWLISGAIVILVVIWLLSGQIGSDASDAEDTTSVAGNPAPTEESQDAGERTKVRVRVQHAEQVTRTITVNGRTAPARTVELAAETSGRVVSIGIDRGERISEGGIIVRLDERDRKARLEQARATVKQRELEFEARTNLQTDGYVSGIRKLGRIDFGVRLHVSPWCH